MNFHHQLQQVMLHIDKVLFANECNQLTETHNSKVAEYPLSLAALCNIACLSRFHFHRVFKAQIGITLNQYVLKQRLSRAAYQLAYRDHLSILDIALDNYFDSAESFSRAFKRQFACTPSQCRHDPAKCVSSHTLNNFTNGKEEPFMVNTTQTEEVLIDQTLPSDVSIVDFPDTQVALLIHQGDPQHLPSTLRRFIAWRKDNKCGPKVSATFNLLFDDPESCQPQDYRFGLAAELPAGFNLAQVTNSDLTLSTIPAGRCAVLRHQGDDNTLGQKVDWLYQHWLSQSGEQLRDFPIYLHRISFYPETPQSELITDIYLPLEG
ncbi:AraC family transcriptional regulator [Flocculibacter collagenilyticus]|uniref:AraC family transcriptional regulator n=1 Tax=Flocculibacter collagenilyticus TaxID=2744479 RepID=UPI0018F40CE1|nr:GyrI-like domain-containing protein [Flocculibacter collagenilyticus]